MSCLGRAAVPVKRVWRGLSARLRRRRRATGKPSSSSSSYYAPMDRRRGGSKDYSSDGEEADMDVGALAAAGLGRLRKDVRTCEYSDVQVMWEMLSTSNGDGRSSRGGGGGAMAGGGGDGKGRSRRRSRVGRKAAVTWNRLASYCCAL